MKRAMATRLPLHVTRQVRDEWLKFAETHPVWVMSEANEMVRQSAPMFLMISRRHNGRFTGGLEEAQYLVIGGDENAFFAREFREPNHRRSAMLAKSKMNTVDNEVFQRWLFEEQHEPQHTNFRR